MRIKVLRNSLQNVAKFKERSLCRSVEVCVGVFFLMNLQARYAQDTVTPSVQRRYSTKAL